MQQKGKRFGLMLVFVCVLTAMFFPTSWVMASKVTPSSERQPIGQNVAVGKPASADSAEPINPAASANDGDAATSWYAQDNKTGHEWTVNLEKKYQVTGVSVQFSFPETAPQPFFSYQIQTSNDQVHWHTAAIAHHRMAAGVQNYSFAAPATQYVRIRFTSMSSGQPAQLAEVGVYATDAAPLPVRGVDLSMLQALENHGAHFSLHHQNMSAMQIMSLSGVNYVRLRLWVNPPGGLDGLPQVIQLAKAAKAYHLKVLLDLHYSDFWADPGKQTIPKAWQGQTYTQLKQTVYNYTKRVIEAFNRIHVTPDMVQVGNEVTNGMLWPVGEVGGTFATSAQWLQFAGLMQAGIQGVRAATPVGHTVQVMVHVDDAGGNAAATNFFTHLYAAGVHDFSIIGISYYPFWDGSLADLKANLDALVTQFKKNVIVAETAYPWTLVNADHYPESVSQASQLLSNYPATPLGQERYMEDLLAILQSIPQQRGLGVFYWEPDWIPVKGVGWEPGAGDNWGNMTMFTAQGEALQSLQSFLPYAK